jgi:hypothetical protein
MAARCWYALVVVVVYAIALLFAGALWAAVRTPGDPPPAHACYPRGVGHLNPVSWVADASACLVEH